MKFKRLYGKAHILQQSKIDTPIPPHVFTPLVVPNNDGWDAIPARPLCSFQGYIIVSFPPPLEEHVPCF